MIPIDDKVLTRLTIDAQPALDALAELASSIERLNVLTQKPININVTVNNSAPEMVAEGELGKFLGFIKKCVSP